MGDLIGLVAVVLIFGTPFFAMFTTHQRKVLEMKLKASNNTDARVLDEIRSLRAQLDELRDTSTKYDMSIDTALQRLDNRVSHIEGRISRVEQGEVMVSRESRV